MVLQNLKMGSNEMLYVVVPTCVSGLNFDWGLLLGGEDVIVTSKSAGVDYDSNSTNWSGWREISTRLAQDKILRGPAFTACC